MVVPVPLRSVPIDALIRCSNQKLDPESITLGHWTPNCTMICCHKMRLTTALLQLLVNLCSVLFYLFSGTNTTHWVQTCCVDARSNGHTNTTIHYFGQGGIPHNTTTSLITLSVNKPYNSAGKNSFVCNIVKDMYIVSYCIGLGFKLEATFFWRMSHTCASFEKNQAPETI